MQTGTGCGHNVLYSFIVVIIQIGRRRKVKKRRKVHRLNLFFLWAGEVVGKCWMKKHGVVSVVTTEKTRGLFKSLWLFGEEGGRRRSYREMFNTAWLDVQQKAPLATLYMYVFTRRNPNHPLFLYEFLKHILTLLARDGIIENLTHSLHCIYSATILAHLDFNLNIWYLIVWQFLFSSFYRYSYNKCLSSLRPSCLFTLPIHWSKAFFVFVCV